MGLTSFKACISMTVAAPGIISYGASTSLMISSFAIRMGSIDNMASTL